MCRNYSPNPEQLMSAKSGQARLGAYLWRIPLSSAELADALESIDLGNIKKSLMLKALRNQSDSKDIANLKWYLAIGGKETGTPIAHVKCGSSSIPIVTVNRKLKSTPNPPRIQRLISGSEIDSIVRPRIKLLGDDPAAVGIVSIYFVNSSMDVLWGDRLSNPPRPQNWEQNAIPYIASISMIVPDAAKGTMYVGVDIPQIHEDDTEVESDD